MLNHSTETVAHWPKMARERPEQTGHERRDVTTAFFRNRSRAKEGFQNQFALLRDTRPDSPGDAHPDAGRHLQALRSHPSHGDLLHRQVVDRRARRRRQCASSSHPVGAEHGIDQACRWSDRESAARSPAIAARPSTGSIHGR